MAKELVEHGVTVLVGSRDLSRGKAAAEQIGLGANPIQLDVTDRASIAAAAERIRTEFGRLDLLVNNAAISNTGRGGERTLADYATTGLASNASLDEVRAIWETNVFGVLTVYQAMLPLLRASSDARIVNVSSGVGSLAGNADPAGSTRAMFGPGYAASKAALNAMTLAMMVELESTPIKVNLVSPGFTRTNLNGFEGTQSIEEGPVRSYASRFSAQRARPERSRAGRTRRSPGDPTVTLQTGCRAAKRVPVRFSPTSAGCTARSA